MMDRLMPDRSVRWGRACRVLAVTGVGLVAVPALSVSSASAASTAQTTKKGQITVQQDQWGDVAADSVSKDLTGTYRADRDPGSLYNVTRAIGARSVWSQKDARGRAVTGQGVTVALLDSGIAPVPGLSAAGKVVQGPDLSMETNSDALRALDTFGHGTHLGAIIGAADPVQLDPKTGEPKGTSAADQLGVAPGATLLPLKLATSDGSTDVSQVVAALDWVSQHRDDNGMHVRVVNLSFGTDSLQPYQLDPLAAAAENAWRRGVVVVVSGGNEGQLAGRLTDPAMDPYVLAVGASDPQLKTDWSRPVVADFSNSGNDQRHVDLLAPGRSITSLRDPGSFVDDHHPEGLVAGDASGRLFRGSGTSQAAAVVSGAAALLLQANPALTPDQVKAALVGTARPLTSGVSAIYQGAGQLDVNAAVALVSDAAKGGPARAALATAVQRFPVATGDGSLEAARGGSRLNDPVTGGPLLGEVDVQGRPFSAATWSRASAAGTAWTGGSWNGGQWTGAGWSGTRWSSTAWTGMRWSGMRWSDVSWDGMRWSGMRWSSSSWSGMRWSGMRWSGMRWSGSSWR